MRSRFPEVLQLLSLTGCLVLFTATAAAFRQPPGELDSLAGALAAHAKKDTAYLETLITLARKIRMQDFGKSEAYFTEAIALSKSLSDDRRLVRSYNGAGITSGMQDKYSEAIGYFNHALELALEKDFTYHAGISYGMLGIVYKRMGEYTRSLESYTRSLRICEALNDAEGIASANSNLGVLFDMMMEPEKALEYFNRALAWYQENHSEKNDYGKSIASLRSNIGNIHTNKGSYELAVQNYQAAMDYYREHHIPYSMLNTLSNMGWMYYKKGDLTKAEEILQQSLTQVNNYNLPQQKVSILYSLARTKADQGSYREGIRLALEAEHLADSIRSLKKRSDAQSLLSYVYEKAGDPVKALDHYKQFGALQDSLFNKDKARTYKSQQVLMEVHEKEKELKAQTREMAFLNRQIMAGNRWKWLLGITCLILLLAGSLYYQRYRQRRKYADELQSRNDLISKQKAEIEEMNTQLEKRMLRAQMNPHFIFNALSAIQHFIITNDKVASLHYLSLFSTMLRQVLETSVSPNMALKEEIEFLKVYLELEALRFEKDFIYKINVDDSLDIEMLEIPAMVIQPFVENAILHGLMPQNGPRKLTLDICDDEEYVACTITDNGIGREKADLLGRKRTGKKPSRGIFLAQQRLNLLDGDHRPKTGVSYIDLKDETGKATGTRVVINIPKQEL